MSQYLQPRTYLAAIERMPKLPFTLLGLFPRVPVSTRLIEIPIQNWDARDVHMSTEDGESLPVGLGEIEWQGFEPGWIKLFHKWTHEDVTIFDRAFAHLSLPEGQLLPEMREWIAKAGLLMQNGVTALEIAGETRRNIMCAGALQGEITGTLADGNALAASLGLQTLTEASTKWDNIAATIISDVRTAKREFKRQNPAQVLPDTAIIHELLVDEIAQNTEIKNLIVGNPAFTAGYLGLTEGQPIVQDDGTIVKPKWLGLDWIVVNDEYLDTAGASAEVWDWKQITYLHRGLASPRWSQTIGDKFTPNLGANYETEEPNAADRKVWKTHRFDKGIPHFAAPQYVQRQRVVAA